MSSERLIRYALDLQTYLQGIESNVVVADFSVCLIGAALQFSMFDKRSLDELCACAPRSTTKEMLRRWMWEHDTPSPSVQRDMLAAIASRLRYLDLEFKGAGIDLPTARTERRVDLDRIDNI